MSRSRLFRCVLLAGLTAVLAGCVMGPTPMPGPASSRLPVFASVTPAPTPALPPAIVPPASAMLPAGPTEVEPQEALPLPPVPADRVATGSDTQPFFLGVSTGDAYSPISLAVDAGRGRAYVYHADSAEHRAVVSVVDLNQGQVVRVIRLAGTQPSGYARLVLSPDGGQAYVIDSGAATLTPFDPETGALSRIIAEISDAVLSNDGRTLYVRSGQAVRAFNLAELLAGNSAPIWSAGGPAADLVLNGDRVLVSVTAPEAGLRVLDAATGQELAMTSLAGYPMGSAPGPDGGWAVRVSGDTTQVIRFDRDLRPLVSAAAPYGSGLYYDVPRARYLVAGPMPGHDGQYAVLALAAGDLAAVTIAPWASFNVPDVFAAYGDLLVGLNRGGPGHLVVFEPDLTLRGRIVTGVRLTDMALDEARDTLYVADDQGRVHLLALPTGFESATWAGSAPIALDAANRRLYVNAADGVQALDLASGQIVASFPQRGMPAPAPRADLVYIADRGVTMYDRGGRKLGALAGTFPQTPGLSPNPYVFAVYTNPVTGALLTIFNNGVPGSNNASYPGILLENASTLQGLPAPHSFVADLSFDAASGDSYLSYSPTRGQEMIQRLAAEGHELARLAGRTGLLALDAAADVLYAVQAGVISGLDPETLALLGEWQGPSAADRVALNSATRQLYVIDSDSPRVTVLPVEGLRPFDRRPQPVGALPGDADMESLAVVADGVGGQWLFAAINGTPYRSQDAVRWEKLPAAGLPAWGHLTCAEDGALFYAPLSVRGADGIWRSTDFGASWSLLVTGLSDLRPAQAVRAVDADTAYFIGRTGGLSAWQEGADDAAGRWEPRLAASSDWENVGSLALAPDGTLFLNRSDAIRRSTDGGQRWQDLPPLGEGGALIGFSPRFTTTHTLYGVVGYGTGPLMRSTDAAATWQPLALGSELDLTLRDASVIPGDGTVYLYTRGYGDTPSLLLRSTDLGESWETADAPEVAKTTVMAVAPSGELWFGLRGGVIALSPDDFPWIKPGRGVGGNMPAPAARPAATPAPTAAATPFPTPTPYVIPCAFDLSPDDADVARRHPELGCPVGDERTISMARQRFQRAQMLWLSVDPGLNWSAAAIFVLADSGAFQRYADAYQDDLVEPVLAVPAGLRAPMRGFGLIWREHLGGPNAAIGWAVEPESGVDGRARAWSGGRVVRIGGEQYVLLNSGAWR